MLCCLVAHDHQLAVDGRRLSEDPIKPRPRLQRTFQIGRVVVQRSQLPVHFRHQLARLLLRHADLSAITSSMIVSIPRRIRYWRTTWLPTARSKASMARSEEHPSELQSLMRISYAVFCLKKKK